MIVKHSEVQADAIQSFPFYQSLSVKDTKN